MPVVTADGLSVSFGKKVLLDEVSFAVQPGDRIGLVGPNGSGKSTLLRILAGEQDSDHGELHWQKGTRVGYLPQDILEIPAGPLVDSVLSMIPGREALEKTLAEVEASLAEAEDDEARLEISQHLADLHHELASFEEEHGRHRAERILTGLGFDPDRLERPVAELSGGWKMRVALAGLLLLNPDLLLLDEPTNHLDIPSLQWFDGFLRSSQKCLILVSHDREFLNRQVSRILYFAPEGLRSYPGNYEAFREQRAEEERNLELRARRQAAERERLERFINRFRAKASKAKQVQSKIKLLEKQDTIQVLGQHETVRFRFPPVSRSGKEVIKLEGIAKRFGNNVVYDDLSQTVFRGDRVAVVGKNGAGKTTLLKIIAGELAADDGRVTIGHNVELAYYAQHHTEKLDPQKTILEEVWSLVPTSSQTYVRSVLGSFLFRDDDVEKRIGVLSGGEKARVALASLLVEPSNLMLMDEPTNHLDLESSERLVDALTHYDGTLVFVSHNKSFINQLATRVWDVQDGKIVDWPGNLDDYFYHLETSGEAGGAGPVTAPSADDGPPAGSRKERRRREALQRQERAARIGPLKKRLQDLESRIAALETEKKEIEPRLADPELYNDYERARPLLHRFDEIQEQLEPLYEKWTACQEQLERAIAEE